MAHHLAELIDEAERSKGAAKQQAEERAVELILKLWTNRRALPTPADPLSGHLPAIKVLAAMLPTADPWRRFRRTGSNDELLHDMFGALVHLVISGLLLTRGGDIRAIEGAEWEALSDEEKFLVEILDRWHEFFVTPAPSNVELENFYATFLESGSESGGKAEQADESGEQKEADPELERRAILSHVEVFQARLADLIEQWRNTCTGEGAGEHDEDD